MDLCHSTSLRGTPLQTNGKVDAASCRVTCSDEERGNDAVVRRRTHAASTLDGSVIVSRVWKTLQAAPSELILMRRRIPGLAAWAMLGASFGRASPKR